MKHKYVGNSLPQHGFSSMLLTFLFCSSCITHILLVWIQKHRVRLLLLQWFKIMLLMHVNNHGLERCEIFDNFWQINQIPQEILMMKQSGILVFIAGSFLFIACHCHHAVFLCSVWTDKLLVAEIVSHCAWLGHSVMLLVKMNHTVNRSH